MGMKTITIKMDDDVFKKLKRAVMVKKIATGYGGIIDSFTNRVVQSVEQGLDEKHIHFKNKNGAE